MDSLVDCLLSLPPHARRTGSSRAPAAAATLRPKAAAEDSAALFSAPPHMLALAVPFGGSDCTLARVCVEAAPSEDPRACVLNIWSAAALEGLISIDAEGTIVEASLGAALILGFRESELVGASVTTVIPAVVACHHQAFVAAACCNPAGGARPKMLCTRRVVQALHRDGSLLKVVLEVSDADQQRCFGDAAGTEQQQQSQQRKQAAFTARIVLSEEQLTALPRAVALDAARGGDAVVDGRDAARAEAYRCFRKEPPLRACGKNDSGRSSSVVSAPQDVKIGWTTVLQRLEEEGQLAKEAVAAAAAAVPPPAAAVQPPLAENAAATQPAGPPPFSPTDGGAEKESAAASGNAAPRSPPHDAAADASFRPGKSALAGSRAAPSKDRSQRARMVSIAADAADADGADAADADGEAAASAAAEAAVVAPPRTRRKSSTAFPTASQPFVSVAPEAVAERGVAAAGGEQTTIPSQGPDSNTVLPRQASSTIFSSAAERSRLPHATSLTRTPEVGIAADALPQPEHPTRKQSSTVFPGHPRPLQPGTGPDEASADGAPLRPRGGTARAGEITPLPEEQQDSTEVPASSASSVSSSDLLVVDSSTAAAVVVAAAAVSGTTLPTEQASEPVLQEEAPALSPEAAPRRNTQQAVAEAFEGSSGASLLPQSTGAPASAGPSPARLCPFGFGGGGTALPASWASPATLPGSAALAHHQSTVSSSAAAAAPAAISSAAVIDDTTDADAAAADDVSSAFDPELVARARAGRCLFFASSPPPPGVEAAAEIELSTTAVGGGGCLFADAPLGKLPARYERLLAQKRIEEQAKELVFSRLKGGSSGSLRSSFTTAAAATAGAGSRSPAAAAGAASGGGVAVAESTDGAAPLAAAPPAAPLPPLPKKSMLKKSPYKQPSGPGAHFNEESDGHDGTGARDSPLKLARSFLKPKTPLNDSAADHLLPAGSGNDAGGGKGDDALQITGAAALPGYDDDGDGDDLADAEDLRRKRQAEFQRVRRFAQVLKMINSLRMRKTILLLNSRTRMLLILLATVYLVRRRPFVATRRCCIP